MTACACWTSWQCGGCATGSPYCAQVDGGRMEQNGHLGGNSVTLHASISLERLQTASWHHKARFDAELRLCIDNLIAAHAFYAIM